MPNVYPAGTKLTNAKAIQDFFTQDGGRPVTMGELRVLSTEERTDLGKLCCQALGVEQAAAA